MSPYVTISHLWYSSHFHVPYSISRRYSMTIRVHMPHRLVSYKLTREVSTASTLSLKHTDVWAFVPTLLLMSLTSSSCMMVY